MNKILVILSFLAGLVIGSSHIKRSHVSPPPEIILRHDTITVREPVMISKHTFDTVYIHIPGAADSVQVPLPIEQKVYQAPQYRAWVSGYRPTLDSIRLDIPVTEHTVYRTTPASRFSIGIQAGYGLTPKGPQPYIGLGIAYRLL